METMGTIRLKIQARTMKASKMFHLGARLSSTIIIIIIITINCNIDIDIIIIIVVITIISIFLPSGGIDTIRSTHVVCYTRMCLCVCVSVCLCVCVSVCLWSVCLCVCVSVCLCVHVTCIRVYIHAYDAILILEGPTLFEEHAARYSLFGAKQGRSRPKSGASLLYSTLLYSTLLYSTLLYSTLLYSTLLCSALLYSTLLYSALPYHTIPYHAILCYYTRLD